MGPGLRHLHELEVGDRFIDPTNGLAREVVSKSAGQITVTAGRSGGRTVQFTRHDGTEVEFEVAPSSQVDQWSPTAEVEPLTETEETHASP